MALRLLPSLSLLFIVCVMPVSYMTCLTRLPSIERNDDCLLYLMLLSRSLPKSFFVLSLLQNSLQLPGGFEPTLPRYVL